VEDYIDTDFSTSSLSFKKKTWTTDSNKMIAFQGKQSDGSRAIDSSKTRPDTDFSGTFRHRGGEFLDWARSAWHYWITPMVKERARKRLWRKEPQEGLS